MVIGPFILSFVPGGVVQLKAITGALSGDESLSNIIQEKTGLLQQILIYVVSIISGFINLNANLFEKAHLYSSSLEFYASIWGASSNDSPSNVKVPTETNLYWHQKAVVLVMEAGGLNWLVGKVGISKFLYMLLLDLIDHIVKSASKLQ